MSESSSHLSEETFAVEQLQQRIAKLEQALAVVTEQHKTQTIRLEHNDTMLLLGPFVLIRWVGVEGWPIEYVSENVTHLFGYTVDEFLSGSVVYTDVVHPDDLARMSQEIHTYSDAGLISYSQEYRIVQKGGGVRWVYDFTTVIRDNNGILTHYYGYVLDVTDRKQIEVEQAALQQQLITAQQTLLQALSTPLMPVSDHTLVMPLIGAIDSQRAEAVLQTLLNGVAAYHAYTVILDVTGVPIIDTQGANVLLRAAQAVKLLGAQVVLTGIHPEVAQTLVTLGVDLSSIITRSSLQSGIAYALHN